MGCLSVGPPGFGESWPDQEAARGAADAGICDLVVLTPAGVARPSVGRSFDSMLAEPPSGSALPYQTDPGDTAVIITQTFREIFQRAPDISSAL